MVVTRSTPAGRRSRQPVAPVLPQAAPRRQETVLLGGALLAVLIGLALLYGAVSRPFGEVEERLARGQVADLRATTRPEPLLPLLAGVIEDPAERRFVAERIARHVGALGGRVPNVGELGRIRVPAAEVSDREPGLAGRLGERPSVALLAGEELAALKARLVVRRPGDFLASIGLWVGLVVAAFLLVHVFWRLRGFHGDELLLPAVALLAGLGLLLAISFRDPLRDLALYRTFAQGVLGGLALLAAASLLDVERSPLPRLTFAPLAAAVGLSVLLILFGSGPGGSDAKVNLFGFQPVEAIKILVVLFLAGYFLHRWEFLRELREERAGLARISSLVRLPKLEYALPPVVAIAVVLFFFFLQRDLGPALVLSLLFFSLYGVARGRALLPAVGLLLVGLAFFVGYKVGYPRTVTSRIAMWVSPWDNPYRGGDHLAQSLWALAGGEATGTGLGLGQPERVPEVHTDAVLAGLGEELGFLGLAAVFALYTLLVARGFRAALRSGGAYGLFLGLGLALLLALNVVLIAGGVTGLLPLSGVVSPFLSSGRSALLANFFIVGLLAALSARAGDPAGPGDPPATLRFRPAVGVLGIALAVPLVLILGKLAWVQLLAADRVLTRGALALQADGLRRFTYNPRLADIAETIPRGSIVDRNGLPLATGDPAALVRHRAALTRLGANLAVPAGAGEGARLYPLGGRVYYLLGDVRTRARWGASNTSFAERDRRVLLQGYDDYAAVVDVRQPDGTVTPLVRKDFRELIPLLRHRHQPDHPAVRAILERDRTVRMTIDARLQVRASEVLERAVRQAGAGAGGAAVVLDARTGELLAAASYPWPRRLSREEEDAPEVIDRARYGIYPPGSTFKLVTAMAALRKDPATARETFACVALPGGRVGNRVRGWGRPVRDDPTVTAPHGQVDLPKGIRVSCNAYFAQLAVAEVKAEPLLETARLLGIAVADPNTAEQLGKVLPQAAYGQGQVIATPLQMTRVAATVAAGGTAPEVRWYRPVGGGVGLPAGEGGESQGQNGTRPRGQDGAEPRGQDGTSQGQNGTQPRGLTGTPPGQDGEQPEGQDTAGGESVQILPPDAAALLARSMRSVVTQGTAARLLGEVQPPLAGKTGTAEVAGKRSHSWFIAFAPYGGEGRRIAVGVVVEHGGYGGRLAAPAAAEIVRVAADLGLIQ